MRTQTDFFKFKVNPKMAFLNYNNNNKGSQLSAIIQKYPINNNNNISCKNTNYNHRYYLNNNPSNNIINSYKKNKLSSYSQKKTVSQNKTNTGFYLSNVNNFANFNKDNNNNNSINSFMNNNLNKPKINNVNKPTYKSYSSTMPRKTNSYQMKSTTRTNFYSPALKKLKIVNDNNKKISNYNNNINNIKNLNNINNNNINSIMLSNILNERYPMYQDAKHSDNSFDLISGYGVNTYKGIIRNYNEDRVSIVVNAKKPNSENSNDWPKISFFGIYDGHAGNKCSEYLKNNLHNFIFNSNDFPNNPMKSIEQGFKTCENNFMKLIHDKTQNQYNDFSGSCAIIILIIDDICYTINLGDSRAIYSYDKGNKFYQLSRDHKPDDLIEKKRIYKAGGSIFKPNISQFCIGGTLNYGIKESDLGIKIPYRILPGRLAVSFF